MTQVLPEIERKLKKEDGVKWKVVVIREILSFLSEISEDLKLLREYHERDM